jgi:dihydroorotase
LRRLSQAKVPVVDTEALLRAMEYAATFDFQIFLHPQDYWLSRNGIAHEGEVSSRLGLAGIPVAAETIAIATIVQLVRDTGCRVHLTRLSSGAGVALVKQAIEAGLPVTFDVGVHHLLLTENDIGFFNPHARFCPPCGRKAIVRPCRMLPLGAMPPSVPTIRRWALMTSCCRLAKPNRGQPVLKCCCH